MDRYEMIYPNCYTEKEKAALEQYKQRGGMPTYTIGPITSGAMWLYARCWDKHNPLFNDEQYAKGAGYDGIPAIPGFAEPKARKFLSAELGDPASPNFCYIGDGYDHEIQYFKNIYAGDTLTVVADKNDYIDITPKPGSTMRGFVLINEALMYNQRGEVVAHGIMRWPEFRYKYLKGEKKPNPDSMRPNMSDRYEPPVHIYTDDDWDYIKDIWNKEYIRGQKTLYWDDVHIGDEPAWVTEGPITQMDMIRLHGYDAAGARSYQDHIEKSEGRFLKIEAEGVFYPDNFSHFMSHFGARPQFYNTTCRNLIIKMLTNWCSDAGFLSRICWRIINNLPPTKQKNHFPIEYARPSYLLNVPYLRQNRKYLNVHGNVPDCPIAKGYVTNKFIKDDKHIVQLVCWTEDLDENISTECLVEVVLPCRHT